MAKLLILSGKRKGAEVELPGEGEVVDIGNRDSAKLAIHDPWISFNHAQIKRVNGRYLIEDQGSSNGTWVLKGTNAERVERHELSNEDVFALGNTRVRFLGEGKAATKAVAADKPWWDKVIDDDGTGKADGQRVRLLKRELAEEKRMRLALEKFLDLPVGASVGDVAEAGKLKTRVSELESQLETAKESAKGGVLPQGDMLTKHTQRLRRGHMSEVVSLEGRATTAEAKVADLEQRLRERTETVKKERAEQRTEIERLQHELDEIKAGGIDPSMSGENHLEAMTEELTELRSKFSKAEERTKELEQQLQEAKSSSVEKSDVEGIKAELKASLEQVAHHKGEEARLIDELDTVSMEQIETEERLQKRIRDLEGQLREAGQEPVPAAEEPKGKSPTGKTKRKATGKSKRKKTSKAKAKPTSPKKDSKAELEPEVAKAELEPVAKATESDANTSSPPGAKDAAEPSATERAPWSDSGPILDVTSDEQPVAGLDLEESSEGDAPAANPFGDPFAAPTKGDNPFAASPQPEEPALAPDGADDPFGVPPQGSDPFAAPSKDASKPATEPVELDLAAPDSGELEFNPLAEDEDEAPKV